MAIKMVREPSETPNINNIDDIVPMRYAYGNQNGFVIGKGTEISNTISGLNFTVNSGRLVLQGVECDIDATGVTITIDNIATKRYYTIYLEVNLGLNTATIKDKYDTATYPTIDAGDDLTENTTGVARLPLYQFTATSGIISEVNKVVESVKYVNQDFIKNVKVNDASKVNNLEIKQDENGIIKNSNNIISQKQLLWSGSFYSGDENVSFSLNRTFNDGDIIEIAVNNYYMKGKFPEYSPFMRFHYSAVDYVTGSSFGYPIITLTSFYIEINQNGLVTLYPQSNLFIRASNGDLIETSNNSYSLSAIYEIIE